MCVMLNQIYSNIVKRGRTENSECLVSGRGPVCKWAGFGCQSDTKSLEQKIEKEKTESGLKRRICS